MFMIRVKNTKRKAALGFNPIGFMASDVDYLFKR
jgi:hypothetical protein